ncbi:hypothetical protein [Streptomyces sp. NPDC004629]|uniref:hypothetical protein n=1 Tax=Streptomyces sp. NPDC004629 TaxID=3364705 RepID=UPI0036A59D8F
MTPGTEAARTSRLSLRIAHWNAHRTHDDHRGRRHGFVDEPGRHDFDVICLQECRTDGDDRQADRLRPHRTIVRHLESIESEPPPPLVGADHDAEPDSGELRRLTGADAGAAGDTSREPYLAGTGRRDDSAGHTVDASADPLVRFARGRRRTDHLLAGTAPRDRCSHGRTAEDCGQPGAGPDRPSSDHYGLWSQLPAVPPLPTAPAAARRPADEPPSVGRNGPEA